MKRIFSIVFTFFCSVGLAQDLAEQSLPIPLVIPLDDGPFSLEVHAGKVVLLDFWASWCGPCRQSFPWMNGLQSRFGKENFEVIAINLDEDHEDANTFLREVPAAFSIKYDSSGKSAEMMQVQGMPMSYLIDREGRVHSSLIGFSPIRAASHEAEILSLIHGKKTQLEGAK